MRKLILSALLLAAAPAAVAATDPVLGTWVCTQRSAEGLGMILTFSPDSKLQSNMAALVETWYRTEGDKFLQPGAKPTDPPTVAKFHFDGNTLEFNHENDPPLRLTRVGSPAKGAPAIVGKWSVDGQKTIEYTTDGLIKIRYPINSQSGTWDGATNTFTVPGGKGQYRLENGLLVVKFNGSVEQQFIRADASKEEIKKAGIRYGDKPTDLDPPASH